MEFVIIIPILLLLCLGILQFSLFFIAKSTLNQATFSGARQGAVNNASLCSIRRGIVKGLVPLYQTSGTAQDIGGYLESLKNAWLKIMGATPGAVNSVSIDILNPGTASFSDFKQTIDGEAAIPNSRLLYRNTSAGSNSKQNIQDANLLKIRVHYCYKVIVPPVRLITKAIATTDSVAFNNTCYGDGGVPLQSDATILMQSAAKKSSIVETLGLCAPF